jgi:hypothetical protein
MDSMINKIVKHLVVTLLYIPLIFTELVNVAYAIQKGSNLDAHVHGLSELTIAMDDHVLDIEFASPAMNLLGFEYKATSDKDIATVKKVESLLLKHNQLFLLSDAGCTHVKTTFDLSDHIDAEDHKQYQDHEDHHGHKKHKDHHDEHQAHNDHDKHHKHHKDHDGHSDHNDHDDHAEHSDHKNHGSDSHSEIVANYSYHCKDTSKLSKISVSLFKIFPGIHEIEAIWITSMQQGSTLLKPSSPVIALR